MKKMLISFLLVLGLLPASIYADDCKTWNWNNNIITMETCANSSGSSGYLVVRNNTSKDINVCWRITYENGKESTGCKARLIGYAEEHSSAYRMGQMDVVKLQITKLKRL